MIVQVGEPGVLVHVMPTGSESVRVTLFATPGPALWTVIVKPSGSPALTVDASGVLVTLRFGHWTVIVAVLSPLPSLLVVTEASLETVPQVAAVVVVVRVTVLLA